MDTEERSGLWGLSGLRGFDVKADVVEESRGELKLKGVAVKNKEEGDGAVNTGGEDSITGVDQKDCHCEIQLCSSGSAVAKFVAADAHGCFNPLVLRPPPTTSPLDSLNKDGGLQSSESHEWVSGYPRKSCSMR